MLPEALKVSQLHTQTLKAHGHTLSCHLWSPFPFISHSQGEAAKRLATMFKSKRAKTVKRGLLRCPQGCQLPAFLFGQCKGQERAQHLPAARESPEFITKPLVTASPQLPITSYPGKTTQNSSERLATVAQWLGIESL